VRNLYTEIDLLEIVKQLRISKFMSQVVLTRSQRELVKFLKQYTLLTRVPRKHYVTPGQMLRKQSVDSAELSD
jgi:hypothetical protein